jgi:hypothetical protein
MNENLSQLVKETKGDEEVTFSENELDIPETNNEQNSGDENSIGITNLTEWFNNNVENFPNIRKPTVSIQGVDPDEQLIITISIPDSEEEGKRKLVVFDDANTIPVIDLPAMDMQVYNNGFRIIYDLGQGVFVKSYGIRTGLISIFCHDINDKLIPYSIIKTKKNDSEIVVPHGDIEQAKQKLPQTLDIEALQLRYKQSSKAGELETIQDAIDWLLERQASIADINHHLQVDNVIIQTLA